MILDAFVPVASLLLNTLDRFLFPFPRRRTSRDSRMSRMVMTAPRMTTTMATGSS